MSAFKPGLFKTVIMATLMFGVGAHAESSYPNRSITVVVPFAAGGEVDTAARLVAERLGGALGQAVIIQNRVGASGTIGMAYVARAKPDGYTLGWGSSSALASSPYLYKDPGYDPIKSFRPINMATSSAWVLLVAKSSPIKSVADLVRTGKAAPGKLTYASAGINSNPDLIGKLFTHAAAFTARDIPYKGGIESSTAVMANQVDFTFDAIASHDAESLNGSNLRAIAVTSQTRSRALPDVPTLAESGLPTLTMVTFNGLVAPIATPPEVVQKLDEAMRVTMNDPALRAKISRTGNEPMGRGSQEFAATIAQQTALWQSAIKLAGAHPQ
ncbi:MAG: Bug family tripartite tricarboxylate transporter substrate binding protein [Janthinobacterium lividum]